jgi:leucyl-tRNA synthetase
MAQYDHKNIEAKWNLAWYEHNVYAAKDFDEKPKKYILCELPYPSGKALHAGHMMRFTVPDIYSRYLRMKGYNVMFPIGWDAFGLPAENYAIKTGTHPAQLIQDTVKHYKSSIRSIGYGIDWQREIDTTDPKYYKWTQWIFLKFYEAGLAKYKEMPIWWCDELKTVLSDEEVLTDKNGNKISERGEFPVVKKKLNQWILDIQQYADKLLEGLETVEFPEAIKNAQRNWIGRSEGALIDFDVDGDAIQVFTTKPETLFGVSFLALAPEHNLVAKLTAKSSNKEEVDKYVQTAKNKTDLERTTTKAKTGIQILGVYAKHPLNPNSNPIPIFVADYVLPDVGTGSLMGVPAHDERDYEFAHKFNLPIVTVIEPDITENLVIPYLANGKMINSDKYNGMLSQESAKVIVADLESLEKGKPHVTYKIREWVFSRQRYWGEPIPMVHKANGDIEAIVSTANIDEVHKVLPLTLPDVPDYNPTSDGSSPLEKNVEWVNTVAKDGSTAKRETNTMPNWAGSCWYYLRYIDPTNDQTLADQDKLKYWLPVDKYFGGAEHTTLHLLYSRFWHKFLYDLGYLPTDEPYAWRMNGGILLGPDGKKMSKSRGNVVEPIELIDKYGADALRMYIAFLGPYDETYPWSENGIKATRRLINNLYELKTKVHSEAIISAETKQKFNKTVKNVTEMIENLKMNTAVSEFMILLTHLRGLESINKAMWIDLIKLIAPFAPFVAEELWNLTNDFQNFAQDKSVHLQQWPIYDSALTESKITEIPVQINGKLRAQVAVDDTDNAETIKEKLYKIDKLKPYLANPIKKLIYLPGKIVNVVN